MFKRINLLTVLLTMVASLMCVPVSAGNVIIDTLGAMPFLYEDHSYLPLQNVASFLGAQLSWDPAKAKTVMTYQGKDLSLTPNSLKALLMGQPVELPSESVVVDGRTYIPAEALRKFYGIPVEWDKVRSDVRIKGQSDWGRMKVKNRPPWHGGPPPWAPAWGERRNQGVRYPQGNNGHHKGEWKQKGKVKVKAN